MILGNAFELFASPRLRLANNLQALAFRVDMPRRVV